MARSKSHKDDEDIRGRIRELEKENRALRRRLRKLEKSKHVWEQYNLDADENTQPEGSQENKAVACPSCGSGTLLPVDLGVKWLFTCSSCLFRKTSLK